jgi:hypothetical protein
MVNAKFMVGQVLIYFFNVLQITLIKAENYIRSDIERTKIVNRSFNVYQMG